MADRCTEERVSVLLTHGQQGDLQIELQELLDDHPGRGAPGTAEGRVPRLLQPIGAAHHALTFPGGAHHGLHDHGPAQWLRDLHQLFGAGRVGESRCPQSQFSSGEITDSVPVHRHSGGSGRGDHRGALLFQLSQGRHGQGFDLRDHHIRSMSADHLQQIVRIRHRQHFGHIRHLHRRSIGIAVAGDHPTTESLGRDRNLLPKLSASKQQNGARESAHELLFLRISPINQTAMNPREEIPK